MRFLRRVAIRLFNFYYLDLHLSPELEVWPWTIGGFRQYHPELWPPDDERPPQGAPVLGRRGPRLSGSPAAVMEANRDSDVDPL